MNHHAKRAVLVVVLALGASTTATSAHATSRLVAVTPFSGPGDLARQAHASVVSIVGDHHQLVPSTEILRASAEAGGDVRVPVTAMTVARSTGADAVVIGQVAVSGDGFKLAISVRHAQTGRSVGAVLLPLFSSFLVAADEDRIRPLLLDLLRQVDPDPVELDAERDIRDTPTVSRVPRKTRSSGAPLPVAIDASAGLAVMSRSLRFVEEPGVSSRASLDARATAGLVVDATVTSRGRTRFGVAIGLERAIGAHLSFGAPGEELDLPVTQSRWRIAALAATRWRRLHLSTEAGYSASQYTIGLRPEGLRIPNTFYGSLAAGAGVRVDIRDKLQVSGAARYLHVIQSGGITAPERFGSARSRGFDVDTGVAYAITDSLSVRAGLRLSRVALNFNGDGEQASNLDDDPGQDVSAAVDSVFSIYSQIALQL